MFIIKKFDATTDGFSVKITFPRIETNQIKINLKSRKLNLHQSYQVLKRVD